VTLTRLIALATLDALPATSIGARASLDDQLAVLAEDGVRGVLAWSQWPAIQRAGLTAHGVARLDTPREADALIARHVDAGLASTTLHVASAFDDDATLDRLAEALLEAATRHDHSVLVETHRATVTQDAWRTLRWVERFPALRFSLDASHWVVGGELDYGGGFDMRLQRLDPILRRSPMVQGRIASGGAVQVAVDAPGPWRDHARRLWTRAFRERLDAAPDTEISFCPELLPHVAGDAWFGYAPVRADRDATHGVAETTDRYAEALALYALADACATEARAATVTAS
jgi:hypothetical protein